MIKQLVLVLATTSLACTYSYGATVTGDILDSSAFSGFSGGTQTFNIWNDATGAHLTSDNGDLDDLTVTYMSVLPGTTGTTPSASVSHNGSGFVFGHGYTAPDGSFSANPGTRIVNMLTIEFAPHVSITDLSVDFSSLNTRGITWEFSELTFLDAAGNPFSTAPTINPYSSHTSNNHSPAQSPRDSGQGGSPSQGWFLVDSKDTVTDPGGSSGDNLSDEGSSGGLEAFTNVDGSSDILGYDEVGLTAGTRVGGFKWTTYLEDVRGTSNVGSNLTSTMTAFSPTGTVTAVPEPSSFLFLTLLGLFGSGSQYFKKRRDLAAAK